jgi:hypothetical protein
MTRRIHCNSEINYMVRLIMCFAFFGERDPSVKLKLLPSYCYSFYGSVLWNLSNPCVEKFCAWRKGIRRVLSLPVYASCDILLVVAGILPVFDEIAGRSAFFIQKCVSSDSHTIRWVANMAVFSGLGSLSSPLGRNARAKIRCLAFHAESGARDLLC